MSDFAGPSARTEGIFKGIEPLHAAAVALFATFFAYMAQLLWHAHASDLSAIYMAAFFYGKGSWGMIYDYPVGFFGSFPPSWEAAAVMMGFDPGDTFPYVYPPLWAALLSPLANAVEIDTFFRIFVLLELSLLGAGIVLAHRIFRAVAMPLWLWAMLATGLLATSIVAQAAIWHLQPQIIVAVLTLWAFERYSSGKYIAAGVLLGLAAGMKIAPVGFALIFLLDRNWRAVAAITVTGVTLGLASLAVGGWQLHLDFFEGAAAASEGIFFTRITYTVELALYALGMWAGAFPWVDTTEKVVRIIDTPLSVAVLTKLLFLGAVVWTTLATWRLPEGARLPARLFLLTLVINCFGPLGWSHYFLPVALMLPGLVGLLPRSAGIALFALFALVTASPAQLWMRANLPGEIPVAALHVALMAVLFVSIAVLARRPAERGLAPT